MSQEQRHAWYVEFERDFRHQCDLLSHIRGVPLECGASEKDWSAWASWPHGGERHNLTLPHNFTLFRPMYVAVNTATRLFDQAMANRE